MVRDRSLPIPDLRKFSCAQRRPSRPQRRACQRWKTFATHGYGCLAILVASRGTIPVLLRCDLTRASPGLATRPADGFHVSTITTHDLPTLPPGATRLVSRPLVRRSLCMRGLPALARDIPLPRGIHRREPSFALPAHRPSHRQ